MSDTLLIFEEIKVDDSYVKAMEQFEKFAKNVTYLGCPWPKGDEFQKLKISDYPRLKEGE